MGFDQEEGYKPRAFRPSPVPQFEPGVNPSCKRFLRLLGTCKLILNSYTKFDHLRF